MVVPIGPLYNIITLHMFLPSFLFAIHTHDGYTIVHYTWQDGLIGLLKAKGSRVDMLYLVGVTKDAAQSKIALVL